MRCDLLKNFIKVGIFKNQLDAYLKNTSLSLSIAELWAKILPGGKCSYFLKKHMTPLLECY